MVLPVLTRLIMSTGCRQTLGRKNTCTVPTNVQFPVVMFSIAKSPATAVVEISMNKYANTSIKGVTGLTRPDTFLGCARQNRNQGTKVQPMWDVEVVWCLLNRCWYKRCIRMQGHQCESYIGQWDCPYAVGHRGVRSPLSQKAHTETSSINTPYKRQTSPWSRIQAMRFTLLGKYTFQWRTENNGSCCQSWWHVVSDQLCSEETGCKRLNWTGHSGDGKHWTGSSENTGRSVAEVG